MKQTPMFILCGLTITLVGCGASQSYRHDEPTPKEINNAVIVGAPFEETWNRMVRNLSAEFFVINNIEKASRIINVSFSTKDPSEYIDCGQTTRTYSGPSGQEEIFTYTTADDSFYMSANDQGFPWAVTRTTELEGRANIYVAPAGPNTDIAVNVRYILKIKTSQQGMNYYEQAVGMPYTNIYTENFDTKKSSKGDASGSRIACNSIGTLEQKILRAATEY